MRFRTLARAYRWSAHAASVGCGRGFGVLAFAALSSATNCANSDPTVISGPVLVAMQSTLAPVFSAGETKIFQVTTAVAFPIRSPGATEAQGLPPAPPYPRGPYYVREDTRISIRYTLTNADAEKRVVALLFDPWNEFVRYEPGFRPGEDDEQVPNLSGIERSFVLAPKSRIVGIVTPDDFLELAQDLGTAQALLTRAPVADDPFGGPVLFNRAMNAQNRQGENDPLLRAYVPKFAVAGIAGVDASLRTNVASNVSLEIVVETIDKQGNRVVVPGSSGVTLARPTQVLKPPAAPPRP
jgi:hypothetical protein